MSICSQTQVPTTSNVGTRHPRLLQSKSTATNVGIQVSNNLDDITASREKRKKSDNVEGVFRSHNFGGNLLESLLTTCQKPFWQPARIPPGSDARFQEPADRQYMWNSSGGIRGDFYVFVCGFGIFCMKTKREQSARAYALAILKDCHNLSIYLSIYAYLSIYESTMASYWHQVVVVVVVVVVVA